MTNVSKVPVELFETDATYSSFRGRIQEHVRLKKAPAFGTRHFVPFRTMLVETGSIPKGDNSALNSLYESDGLVVIKMDSMRDDLRSIYKFVYGDNSMALMRRIYLD